MSKELANRALFFASLEKIKAGLNNGLHPQKASMMALHSVIGFINSDENARAQLLAQPFVGLQEALVSAADGGQPWLFRGPPATGRPRDNHLDRKRAWLALCVDDLISVGMSRDQAGSFVAKEATKLSLAVRPGVLLKPAAILRMRDSIDGDASPGTTEEYHRFRGMCPKPTGLNVAQVQDRVRSQLERFAAHTFPESPLLL